MSRHLPRLQEQLDVDLTVVNIENAAGGFGLTLSVYEEFQALEIDVMTSGNHIFDKKEVIGILEQEPRLLRPENYPIGTPGNGWVVVKAKNGKSAAVINIMGQGFMQPTLDCPFAAADAVLTQLPDDVDTILVDFHAETTSEKMAMGWHLDGRASAMWGTHMHVPTADERVLPKGCAYITDLGMTGCYNSIIGTRKERVLNKFVNKIHERFEPAVGKASICGALIRTDDQTGLALGIERVRVD